METNNRPKHDLYRLVTDRVCAAIEQGTAPWVRPWRELAALGMPRNGASTSGRPYGGLNSALLFIEGQERGYTDNRWLTLKQANAMGHKVRKGEKSTPIYFYKKLEIEERNPQTGEIEKKAIPYLTEYRVFNAQQIEGMPSAANRPPDWNPVEEAERIVKRTGADIRHGGNRAFYAPGPDYIQMPSQGAFTTSADYYGTLLHELAHWTGHESRLNRQFGRFGADEAYAREELRAEWASAMASMSIGIPTGVEHHAAYLGSWLEVLRQDKHEIFRAARDATKIADFLLGRTEEEQPVQAPANQPTAAPAHELDQERRFRKMGEAILAHARSQASSQGMGSGSTLHHR